MEEIEALQAIFPDEFQLQSSYNADTDTYSFPLSYHIALPATDEGIWPPKPIMLHVSYPTTYPQTTGPVVTLHHANNVFEFSTAQQAACEACLHEQQELSPGMPCIYATVAAAKEFFESGAMANTVLSTTTTTTKDKDHDNDANKNLGREDTLATDTTSDTTDNSSPVPTCSLERIQECNQQGLDIAASILQTLGTVQGVADPADASSTSSTAESTSHYAQSSSSSSTQLKGGHWNYTIGLVGKPSAGKSTFFNVATAFARQRDDADNLLGGVRI